VESRIRFDKSNAGWRQEEAVAVHNTVIAFAL
jgi:hypothetical protein